tara:strand:+ start:405 stop:767 length:363 start_codon:yes stop_codon:yes gene_type:complete
MSKDDKKHDLIGHNLETRSFTAETIQEFKSKLNELNNLVGKTINYHTASHGDDYYFEDEVSNQKDLEKYPATTPEFGHFRRPNPYEKKRFAAKAESNLNTLSLEIMNLFRKFIQEDKKHD